LLKTYSLNHNDYKTKLHWPTIFYVLLS
jgi:hypothetical protein